MSTDQPSSASISQPDYWWYRARSELLSVVLAPWLAESGRILDVGSADGPSVGWMREQGFHVPLDIDFDALSPGGVCGSAMALPFGDATFDVVAAFDVVEHCEPEDLAMSELVRVLSPGGRLFLTVPAYRWAWTRFDVDAGHHRRYTKRRIIAAAHRAGLRVERASYLFCHTFPMFAAERLVRKLRPGDAGDTSLPTVHPVVERLLLALCRQDARRLRRGNLWFGSSVVLIGTKPDRSAPDQPSLSRSKTR